MRFADLARGLAAAERFLLAPACLQCGEPTAPSGAELVCGPCRVRWRPLDEPQCARCGQPRGLKLECRLCAEWPAVVGRVRSAVWLESGAREAVHALKYEGWWRVAEPMARAMQRLAPLTPGVFLVPVPLGRRRAAVRGYNQAERLAHALGRLAGLPVVDALARRRETRTQTRLSPEARAANLAGAFEPGRLPPGRPVLVDDVFTTGATLVAAATALAEAGVPEVDAVTFARPRPPVDGAGTRPLT